MSLTSSENHSPSMELKILSYLQPRIGLSSTDKLNYNNLSKGHEGELKLQEILRSHLSSNYLIINDLLLKVNNTEFQIDSLIIGNNKIYPLEIKNYDGDYYIQNDNWYSMSSGKEIRNPLHQLKRSELLLRNFMQHSKFRFSIEPYIIFINPEFYLYKAPLNLPIVFPTQVNRFIKKLNDISFIQTSKHKELIKFFISHHLSQSSYEQLPNYQYKKLKKGIVCMSCQTFLELITTKKLICKRCGNKEDLESAVKRSTIEFATLFPGRKITVSIIQDWCDLKSKKMIRRILTKHLRLINKGRYSHYIFKK